MDSNQAEQMMDFLVYASVNMMLNTFIENKMVFARPETVAEKIKELRPLLATEYQYLFDMKLSQAYEDIVEAAEAQNN